MPKITSIPSKEDEISEIISDVKNLEITKKKEEVEFPKEIDTISDCGDTEDIDDITNKFEHDSYKEYENVIKFRDISLKCVNYIKNVTTLKLSEKQKNGIKLLINKIYAKLIIYSSFIDLNHQHTIYSKYDNTTKDLIFKISRLVNRLTENSYLLRKKTSFKKTELLPFFNNSVLLFNFIIEITSHLNEKLNDK